MTAAIWVSGLVKDFGTSRALDGLDLTGPERCMAFWDRTAPAIPPQSASCWDCCATTAGPSPCWAGTVAGRGHAALPPGVSLTPLAALNRGLALVEGLNLDADLGLHDVPTVAQLVRAASTSRAEAFASRLAAGDFAAAEAIIDLSVGPGDGFDDADARQELRSRERDELARMEARWRVLDARFAAARSRGRISDDDASWLHGQLLQAQPRSADSGYQRDLGRVATELEALARDLDDATNQRRTAVSADIDDAIAGEELAPAWTVKLTDLLDRDELGAAEEYLHRARAGEAPPEGPETVGAPDAALARILTHRNEGITAEVLDAAHTGGSVGDLDFSTVAKIDRGSVTEALAAWRTLSGPDRPVDMDAALAPILRLLGIVPMAVERPLALRQISSRGRQFVDVHGDRSGYAYVPDSGSRSAGRRRFMLCWDDLPMSQLWDLAAADAPPTTPSMCCASASSRPRPGSSSPATPVDAVAKARRSSPSTTP